MCIDICVYILLPYYLSQKHDETAKITFHTSTWGLETNMFYYRNLIRLAVVKVQHRRVSSPPRTVLWQLFIVQTVTPHRATGAWGLWASNSTTFQALRHDATHWATESSVVYIWLMMVWCRRLEVDICNWLNVCWTEVPTCRSGFCSPAWWNLSMMCWSNILLSMWIKRCI